MKENFKLLALLAFVFFAVSCDDEDDNDDTVIAPVAGTISGGPFTFLAGDGVVDNVSGITVSDDAVGANSSFIVTDAEGIILGLPMTIEDLEGNDFDGAGVGICFIWYIRYEDGLTGLDAGSDIDDLAGSFDVSNSITVNRNGPVAGTLSGGPFTFTAGDAIADNVSGITVSDDAVGTNYSFIVTDDAGNILGLPPTIEALEGNDFDGAGVGVCYIWYIRYENGLEGLDSGTNIDDLNGIFDISNSIEVDRQAAGTLTFALTGLEDLGDDLVYEGWVIVDGSPVTTGTFTVSEGALSQTEFLVRQSYLDAATAFVLSIEPAVDTDPAPADTKILNGDFSNQEATVTTAIVADLADAAGSFFLRTPTDEADGMNNGNDENGVWFANPADGSPSLVLPTLSAGWAYEGWVVDENGTPVTTGTFTAVDVADDANPYSGTDASPGFPGEDFFMNAPDGVTFPLDVRGKTVVISIEPVPDNSTAPFVMKPLLGTAGTETAPTTYDFAQNLGSLPSGTVSF